MNKVLFNKAPIVIDTVLASKIGLNEAIVLQQIHYWIEVNKAKKSNFYHEKYWTYNSMKEWGKAFPFFSDATIRRIFASLEKSGILQAGNYNKAKMDRTKWYTIDYEKLTTYISQDEEENSSEEAENSSTNDEQIVLSKSTNAFDQNEQMESVKMSKCIQSKRANAFSQNEQSNTRDYPETSSEINTEISSSSSLSMKDVVEFFRNNFYPLQAYEAEVISDWVNSSSVDLVMAAMKIARKNNARSMRYIERILQDWQDNGIKTLNDLEVYLRSREESKNGNDNRQDGRNSKGLDEPNPYEGLKLDLSDL